MALEAAAHRRGKDAPLAYPDTAYELPVVFGLTDIRVSTLADAGKVLDLAETLVRHGATAENALDAGAATLLAADVIGAVSHENGNPFMPRRRLRIRFDPAKARDLPGGRLRSRGRRPDRKATDPAAAAAMVRQFQEIGLLVFIAGDVVAQVDAQGVKLGEDFKTFPLGPLPAVIHAVNFAVRAGLTFGGIGRGQGAAMLSYLGNRVKAFVCALGPLDDVALAIAAGANEGGADGPVRPARAGDPRLLLSRPAGDGMVQAGWRRGASSEDGEGADPHRLRSRLRRERIRKSDTHVEFGGGRSVAYELVRSAPRKRCTTGDRRRRPGSPWAARRSVLPLGIVVRVAGRADAARLRIGPRAPHPPDRQLRRGTMHVAQRDTTWIRVSTERWRRDSPSRTRPDALRQASRGLREHRGQGVGVDHDRLEDVQSG